VPRAFCQGGYGGGCAPPSDDARSLKEMNDVVSPQLRAIPTDSARNFANQHIYMRNWLTKFRARATEIARLNVREEAYATQQRGSALRAVMGE
jgi:hypothetical protein